MEIVSFKPVEEFKATADMLFEEQKKLIRRVLPSVEIHHIGSTAIPHSLTKGDVDMNVRVKKEDFDTAVRALKEMYGINQPDNWTDSFASFKNDNDLALPFGVQLTVMGSADDVFLAQMDFLLSHPDAVEKMNKMKEKYDGKSMEEYRNAKGSFFHGLFP